MSIGAPALAVLNDRLFLAWTGSDRRLNVMSSADGFNFEHKVVLGETSDVGPSAAEFRHQLYLAWTGSGNNRLNVARSENGTNFAHKQTLNETSKFTPGLTGFVRVADVGVIVIGWTGTDAVQHLNTLSSSDGQTFGNKQTLQQTSPAGPALLFSPARFRWIVSIDGDHRINLFESSEKHQTSAETSIATPAAIPNYIAWTGTDAQHHLNVARLRPTIAATEAERAQEVKPEAGTGWE